MKLSAKQLQINQSFECEIQNLTKRTQQLPSHSTRNLSKEFAQMISPQVSPPRSSKIHKSYLHSSKAFLNIRLNSESKPLPSISNRSFIKKTGPVRGKYRTYTDQIKEEAINLYQQFQDLRFVSRTLRVPIKNIDRWVKHGVTRKKGGQLTSWAQTN